MVFGNWTISEESISWTGEELKKFVIPRDSIDSTFEVEGDIFYEWILLATNEDWLTQNDLYDLNFAFVYAIAKFGLSFDYEIFDATLADQYEQFEDEEDEDE